MSKYNFLPYTEQRKIQWKYIKREKNLGKSLIIGHILPIIEYDGRYCIMIENGRFIYMYDENSTYSIPIPYMSKDW